MRLSALPALLLSLVTFAPTYAAETPDALSDFMSEKGLLAKIEYVGTTVEAKASDLVVHAMGFLGVPYRRGGNNVDTGFDCSGFVRAIYEQTLGLVLPRRAEQQATATRSIERSELQPGDLVFFNTMRHAFSHVGIYLGEGKFIHSPKPGAQVRVENMQQGYWEKRFNGARRVDTKFATVAPAAAQASDSSALLRAHTSD